jgi:hypothetical protein
LSLLRRIKLKKKMIRSKNALEYKVESDLPNNLVYTKVPHYQLSLVLYFIYFEEKKVVLLFFVIRSASLTKVDAIV